MITVQDILDAYEKTGLKPSSLYTNLDDDGKIVSGCVLTALYLAENEPTYEMWRKAPEFATQKYGFEETEELEAGFCGWDSIYPEKKEWYKIGRQAANILYSQEKENE